MTGIGFLGLGAMGAAMAKRLIDAGHRITAWNDGYGHMTRRPDST